MIKETSFTYWIGIITGLIAGSLLTYGFTDVFSESKSVDKAETEYNLFGNTVDSSFVHFGRSEEIDLYMRGDTLLIPGVMNSGRLEFKNCRSIWR